MDQAVYQLDAARAVDGDTVAALVWADRPLGYGLRQRVYSGAQDGLPAEASLRLAWLDTPERGQVGYAEAKADAAAWLAERAGALHVVVFGSGGLGRLLGDVRDDTSGSLSQHQLARGWPPWHG